MSAAVGAVVMLLMMGDHQLVTAAAAAAGIVCITTVAVSVGNGTNLLNTIHCRVHTKACCLKAPAAVVVNRIHAYIYARTHTLLVKNEDNGDSTNRLHA